MSPIESCQFGKFSQDGTWGIIVGDIVVERIGDLVGCRVVVVVFVTVLVIVVEVLDVTDVDVVVELMIEVVVVDDGVDVGCVDGLNDR